MCIVLVFGNKNQHSVIILQLIACICVSNAFKCVNYRECNKSPDLFCSICNETKCVYPFSSIYTVDDSEVESSCLYRSVCETSSCANEAECVQSFGRPMCACGKGYYGIVCDSQRELAEEEITNRVHYKYTVIFGVGSYQVMQLMPEKYGARPVITLLYGKGGYAQDPWGNEEMGRHCERPKEGTTTIELDRNCEFHFYFNIRLPYQPYSPDSVMSENVLQGYFAFINITIKNRIGDALVTGYEDVIKLFVAAKSQEEQQCSCLIKLRNCGKSMESVVTYYRKSTIHLESDLYYYSDGLRPYLSPFSDHRCKKDSIFTWKTHVVGEFRSHDEGKDIPYNEWSVGTNIDIPPFTLAVGIHKISMDVKYVPAGETPLSFSWCYLEILRLPLELIIDQGMKHRVFLEEGVHLTTSQSSDPNFPPRKRPQKHVIMEWSCVSEKVNGTETKCGLPPKTTSVYGGYDVDPELLAEDTEFVFVVRMWTDKYKWEPNDVQEMMSEKVTNISVTVVIPGDDDWLDIECVKNCGVYVRTNEQLILKVTGRSYVILKNDSFSWEYKKVEEQSFKPVPESMMDSGLLSRYILLKENTLEKKTSYVIGARHEKKRPVTPYYFQTDDNAVVYNGLCTILPTKGQRGVTNFNIQCNLAAGMSYLFEFYDKHKEEIEEGETYSGRMLGSSFSGELVSVILTRGNVIVYIINEMGMTFSHPLDVELTDIDVTPEYFSTVKENLYKIAIINDVPRIFMYISFVPDLFKPIVDREDMLINLLSVTFPFNISNVYDAKLAISSLRNVLVGMNKEKNCFLPIIVIKNTMNRIQQTTTVWALRTIGERSFEHGLHLRYSDTKTIKRMVADVMDSIYSLIAYARYYTHKIDENFIEFDLSIYLRKTTWYAKFTMVNVQHLLTFLEFPVKPAKIDSLDEAYSVWTATNIPDCTFQDIIEMNRNMSLFVSDRLMEDLLQMSTGTKTATLRVVDCKQNIAWWSRGHVKSNIMALTFVLHDKARGLKYITPLDKPVEITFNLEEIKKVNFTSVVSQPSEQINPLSLDLNVKIFRLDLPLETFTEIMFLYPPTKHPLRVLVLKNYRPDFELMVKKATIVNDTSPVIVIETFKDDEESIHYVGILPGPEVPAAEKTEVTWEVKTVRCQLWGGGRWTGGGHFHNNSDDRTATCSSTHLSFFSIGAPIPPYTIEPYAEYKMTLVVNNNYLIILVTSIMVLLYLIACIWAHRRDSKDEFLRVVTFLDDNYACDRNPYLVSVWTSSRLDAGTTAHVAIHLHGEENSSRVHILSSNVYKVLKRNTDNWFVIMCPKPLGNLYVLQVWHDNYGSSPEWYCDKICVYDINNKIEYIFPVEQWVALSLREHPEVAVLPAYIEDLDNKKTKLVECFKRDMRESHLLTSILLRHARSIVTRLQRVTILMCCVMIALAWSVFFFATISHPGVDDWDADVAMREMSLAFQILAVNVVFIMLITMAFRKSAKFTYERFVSTLIIRSESTAALLTKQTMDPSKLDYRHASSTFQYEDIRAKSVFERFVKSLYTIRMPQSKLPVYLSKRMVTVQVSICWHLGAWMICISIIVLSVVFIFVSSLGLGFNQSQKCVFTAFLGVVEETCVFTPVVILLSAVLFSLGLKVIQEPPSHNINKGNLRTFYKEADRNERYENIIKMRSLPMYIPIRTMDREKHLERLLRRHKWSMMVEFFIVLMFVIALCSIIFSLWTCQYYDNQETKQILNFGHSKLETVDLPDVNNPIAMASYLQGTFIRALYSLRWYNGKLIAAVHRNSTIYNYRTSDYTWKLLGRPLIRQLRVSPIPCNDFMGQGIKKCIPPYSLDTEDRTVYGVGWTPAKWSERGGEYFPWQYADRPINWLFRQFYCFGGTRRELNYGGYMVYLSPLRFDSASIVADLQEENWFDRMTRAIIIHVTVYNVNQNIISHVMSFVEYPDAVQSVRKMIVFTVPGSRSLNIADFVFISILFYFYITAVRTINKYGLLTYLSRKEGILNLLIIFLGTTATVLLILHFRQAEVHLSRIESPEQAGHFDFDEFAYYFRLVSFFSTVLLVIVILQVFFLSRVGRFITQCYLMFVLSMGNGVMVLAIFVVFTVLQWKFMAVLLDMQVYQNPVEAFIKSVASGVPPRSQQRFEVNHLVTQVGIKTTTAMFIMLFLHYMKVARTKTTSTFNFVTFIVSEMIACVNRKKRTQV